MTDQDVILQRQAYKLRFKNGDMDFAFNWGLGIGEIIGLSHGEIFNATRNIKNDNPIEWRKGFIQQAHHAKKRAQAFAASHAAASAGRSNAAAAYAYRAALQYADPQDVEFASLIAEMEASFQQAMKQLNVPIRPVEIPFENSSLPGYYLEIDRKPRPTVVMVGGGDTFREDLFYFAGYPGWKRDYNVLMVDLPGQGKAPASGFTFRVNMAATIGTCLDWLESHASVKPTQIALYGVSGGGYFTAQATASDSRVNAWIASTPIYDVAEVFRKEFGSALKAPGWAMSLFLKISARINISADIALNKYAWQFGTKDFKAAIDQVLIQAQPVDYTKITCPSLLMMGESEAAELKRQTKVVHADLHQRRVNVTIHEFSALDGADAHCQINNLRLAHDVVFDWLDQAFHREQTAQKADPRIRF